MDTLTANSRPADVNVAAQTAENSRWAFDTAHTHVGFSVRHMMITTVKGSFSGVSGEVLLAEGDLTRATVRAAIDARTIDTRNEQRDTHLKSADFFDVENYPEITFESRRVARKPDGSLTIVGALTIRGVTQDVVLEAEEEGRGIDPWGGERLGFTATTKIDRTRFGLTWNQALEAGGVLVADDVKLTLDVQLVRA
jgi:polyisoprenoid-binding protein YceI